MVSDSPPLAGIGPAPPPPRLRRLDLGIPGVSLLLVALAALVAGAAGSLGLTVPFDWGTVVTYAAPAALLIAGLSLFFVGRTGADRPAWTVVAAGSILVAGGSAIRTALPGANALTVDVITAGGILALALGIARMPRLVGIRHSVVRASMDALAGGSATAVLLWELAEGSGSTSTQISTAVYAVLVAAIVFSAMRPSRFTSDVPFRLAALASIALGAGGIASQSVVDAGLGRSAEALAAAALIVAAVVLRRPRVERRAVSGRLPWWKLVVPYAPVLLMVGVTVRAVLADPTDLGVLPLGLIVVTLASAMSQVAGARENTELMAMERDQLLVAVTHELRTPLTAVAGFSEILSQSWDRIADTERAEMADIIFNQSRYLTGLVTDMVSLVRDELDEIELSKIRVDAKRLIAEAVRAVFDVNDGPLPVKAQVEPFIEFTGDPNRLHQVLVSLLKNALRYGGGRILIVARRDDHARILEVHDDGPGLTPSSENIVWQRFQRGDNELNATVPGSGLGLSLVRSLVAAHGGTSSYRRSEILGGACFALSFPLGDGDIEREWLDPA